MQAAEPGVPGGCGGAGEEGGVAVEVDQADPEPVQPADRFEADEAVAADHDEAADPVRRTRVDTLAPVAADAVLDDELAALDEDLDPVAGGDADAGSAEMVSEVAHG